MIALLVSSDTTRSQMRNFSGLNGEPAFTATHVPVGYKSDPDRALHPKPVNVSIRMEWLARRDIYETTTHNQVTRPLDFSITTERGATVQPLRNLRYFAPGWNAETVKELCALSAWHLNSMKPNCIHQERDAGLDSTPCPVTGYRWGTAWLVEELPEGFLENVKRLFSNVPRAYIRSAP